MLHINIIFGVQKYYNRMDKTNIHTVFIANKC